MKRFLFALIAFSLVFASCKKEDPITPDPDPCGAATVTYSANVAPVIANSCATNSACHAAGSGNGDFTTYSGVKAKVDNGTFVNRVLVQKDMPLGSSLDSCTLVRLQAWVDAGAPNN